MIMDMAELVETAFDQHYNRTSDQPTALQSLMLSDKESDYDWERDGEQTADAIMNAADISTAAAKDIQLILEDKYWDYESAKSGEETEFSEDAYYEEKRTSDYAWQEEWRSFEKSLKTEARFFSQAAASHLTNVFDGIDKKRTREGRPLLRVVGPGTDFSTVYRARVFQSEESLKKALVQPDLHLGPPPASLARAGRMNAHGISVFYGATDSMTALSEIRPPVGSQVLIAQFEIIRPLRLLDLTAVSSVRSYGSVFDPEFASRLEQEMFLRSLSKRMTQPVMPDDEAFEYLATQAVADFLATGVDVTLDGIIFPSVQTAGGGMNIVLFHKAARVETLSVSHIVDTSATTGHFEEDGWVTEYEVTEWVPPSSESKGTERIKESHKGGLLAPFNEFEQPDDPDGREASLHIITGSIRVHVIHRVDFETVEHAISRHTREKPTLVQNF